MHRSEDVSKVSGTGIVAQGVEFDNKLCALTWMVDGITDKSFSSVAIYPNIETLDKIHGHEGRAKIVFI